MRISAAKVVFPKEDQEDILNKIKDCLTTGQLTLGKYGEALEEAFARYTGMPYAIAVANGTCGLEIPLRALGVEGREVLVPTNTFVATAAAAIHAGARVRFVDMDPQTFGLDLDCVRESIGPDTVGVIAVHIAGIVSPIMPDLEKLCRERGLFLLEDAAHAHGSSLNGRRAGSFGVAGSFSFYPTKVMTSGEGGMIVTGSQAIRDQALSYRDQGKVSTASNLHDRLGYNWRLSEVHAILGASQLARLDGFIQERRRIAQLYDQLLAEVDGIELLSVPPGCFSNYYKYIAILPRGVDRARIKAALRDSYRVSLSGEVYELPCHLQPVFRPQHGQGDFPVAEDLCRRHICLPIYPTMREEEAEYVVASIERVLGDAI